MSIVGSRGCDARWGWTLNSESLGRDLARLFDLGAPQVTLEELHQQALPAPSGSRPMRSLVTTVAVFTVVVAGGLVVGLLAQPSGPEQDVIPTPDPAGSLPTSVVETASTTSVEDTRGSCPVTAPGDSAFHPPSQDPDGPPDFVNTVWYGTPELWTFVNSEGQEWYDLPLAADGTLTQKTFWWSERFSIGDPSLPDITVSLQRVNASVAAADVTDRPTTGSNPNIGSFMLVGLNIPEPGCWEVTAVYKGASLSYVVWVGGE